MDRKELKQRAKENLKTQTGTMILCTFLVVVIIGILVATGLGSLATIVISGPLTVGLYYVFEKNAIREIVKVEDLFFAFKVNFGESFFLYLKVSIFTFLWSLLLVIPGIIKSYAYSMSYYILMRQPEISSKEALDMSIDLMKGHKADLFVLQLSFILWWLLVIATFGIAAFWVVPYVQAAETLFYKNIYEDAYQYAVEG